MPHDYQLIRMSNAAQFAKFVRSFGTAADVFAEFVYSPEEGGYGMRFEALVPSPNFGPVRVRLFIPADLPRAFGRRGCCTPEMEFQTWSKSDAVQQLKVAGVAAEDLKKLRKVTVKTMQEVTDASNDDDNVERVIKGQTPTNVLVFDSPLGKITFEAAHASDSTRLHYSVRLDWGAKQAEFEQVVKATVASTGLEVYDGVIA